MQECRKRFKTDSKIYLNGNDFYDLGARVDDDDRSRRTRNGGSLAVAVQYSSFFFGSSQATNLYRI